MPRKKKKVSIVLKIIYGILGILLALVLFYISLVPGSKLGDKMAELQESKL
jgi:hypothetical protein